jgi:hypothetical protein
VSQAVNVDATIMGGEMGASYQLTDMNDFRRALAKAVNAEDLFRLAFGSDE